MAEKYSGIAAGKPMKASDMEAALDTKANISDMTAALDSKVTLTGNETINGTKTFSTAPVVPNKTTAAANNGTVLATEAQVYLKANASDMTTMLATKENLNNKVTVLSSTSNNTQYPAAKAVYDALAA
ncbi:MAG: hypothetical protein LBQ83_02735, partial [Candidatus Margulisbacteria bacterium]|nr:hypothetical protein [Candidatus Margulisiibacteriota bacterium]